MEVHRVLTQHLWSSEIEVREFVFFYHFFELSLFRCFLSFFLSDRFFFFIFLIILVIWLTFSRSWSISFIYRSLNFAFSSIFRTYAGLGIGKFSSISSSSLIVTRIMRWFSRIYDISTVVISESEILSQNNSSGWSQVRTISERQRHIKLTFGDSLCDFSASHFISFLWQLKKVCLIENWPRLFVLYLLIIGRQLVNSNWPSHLVKN